jgi:hypothetical protein
MLVCWFSLLIPKLVSLHLNSYSNTVIGRKPESHTLDHCSLLNLKLLLIIYDQCVEVEIDHSCIPDNSVASSVAGEVMFSKVGVYKQHTPARYMCKWQRRVHSRANTVQGITSSGKDTTLHWGRSNGWSDISTRDAWWKTARIPTRDTVILMLNKQTNKQTNKPWTYTVPPIRQTQCTTT